jgi:hypothetical protein
MVEWLVVAPILPGRQEAWRRFCQDSLDGWRAGYEESRDRLGIRRELRWITRGLGVDLAVVYLESSGPLPPVHSRTAFDRWCQAQCEALHGPTRPGLLPGPPGDLVFRWAAPSSEG